MLGKIVKALSKNQQQRNEPYFGIAPGLDGIWATGNSLDECQHNLSDIVESMFAQGQTTGQTMKIFTGTPSARKLHFHAF